MGHGATVRPAAPDEGPAVRRVVRDAFGDEGDLIVGILDDLDHGGLTRGSLVAALTNEQSDDAVVGHVGLSAAWLDARERLADVWVLSPLSVSPEHQRQGIGGALLESALAAGREAGVPLVFLEGSPHYYGVRGFARARDRGFLPASRRTPVDAFQVAVLPAWHEWMTGALVYPDVWWRHDSAGLRDPVLAQLETTMGAWHA